MNPKTLIPILPSPHPVRHQRSVEDGSPGQRPSRSPLLDPITPACDAIAASEHFGAPPVDTRLLLEQLTAIAASVTTGDMTHPESMLVAQATALNVVFSRLTERAMTCNNLELATPLLRLAFRAQAQCSRALQTLTSMRYPAIFARQLNVAHQQVVTNTPLPTPPPPASSPPPPSPKAPASSERPEPVLQNSPHPPRNPNSSLPRPSSSNHNAANLVRFQKSHDHPHPTPFPNENEHNPAPGQ